MRAGNLIRADLAAMVQGEGPARKEGKRMPKVVKHEDVFKADPGKKVDMHNAKYPGPCPAAQSAADTINTAFGAK
jgi:hypothetical protein